MIVTNPVLFNIIVVLFIAVTTAWIVLVITNSRAARLKNKLRELEMEKEQLQSQVSQLHRHSGRQQATAFRNTPVISMSAALKMSQGS